ncbi:MAG: hypothetical protein M3345_00850 [Actinomycetota bacterium]|nr:hypothetical protein [Actinomycetota bacterium]
MRFAIEAWAPEYGSPTETNLGDPSAAVDVTVERPLSTWAPIAPAGAPTKGRTILFTDGVRRVDARVWITASDGSSKPGICATYAAGAILCDGRAKVVAADVQRGLFTSTGEAEAIVCKHAAYPVRAAPGDSPEQLALGLQQRMGELEVHLASAHVADLVIIDGPLSGRQNIPGAVGYVKTHHVSYLQGSAGEVVGRLEAGQRTPLFLTMTSWSRYSWYMRLPCPPGHPWAGIVRCEASADQEVSEVVRLADAVTAELPQFASCAHKDSRAPQNLYPIAGLERELRRRLGDASYLYRGLLVAAAGN